MGIWTTKTLQEEAEEDDEDEDSEEEGSESGKARGKPRKRNKFIDDIAAVNEEEDEDEEDDVSLAFLACFANCSTTGI